MDKVLDLVFFFSVNKRKGIFVIGVYFDDIELGCGVSFVRFA